MVQYVEQKNVLPAWQVFAITAKTIISNQSANNIVPAIKNHFAIVAFIFNILVNLIKILL